MTAEASTELSEGRVGRYVLEDLVAESKTGSQFWRASDPALRRPVGARLVPIGDPRVPGLRDAARAAAGVHDRRVVQVLDVVQTPQFLAVITEWVTGRSWSEVLESESPEEAVIVAHELGRALQAAHALGVTHGRLRPASVLVTETNEVRLRGLQVDAALYGVAPGRDPYLADLHGIGATLFLGLTGRWPDPEHRTGTVDGIPIVGAVGGRLPSASELVAGVPPELSRLASACMVSGTGERPRMPDVDHAVATLARIMERGSGSAGESFATAAGADSSSPDRMFRRLAILVVAAIAIAAGALVVGSLRPGPDVTGSASPTPNQSAPGRPGGPVLQPLPIASIADFDPQGGDGRENPRLVPLAVDSDPQTAWLTVNYKSSGMDPKAGTGLLLDLGLIRPIREVRLELVGSGTDVEIRIGDELGEEAEDFELLAGAVAAGPAIAIRTPVPVDTRYVLVWLTNLPYADGTYQGGVREVQVLG